MQRARHRVLAPSSRLVHSSTQVCRGSPAARHSERDSLLHGCELVLDEPDIVSRPCKRGPTDGPETMLGNDTCHGARRRRRRGRRGRQRPALRRSRDDRIFGCAGNDLLVGGPGDDEIEGGRGVDRLDGGSGRDHRNGGQLSCAVLDTASEEVQVLDFPDPRRA